MEFPRYIFKAYDIRGIYPIELNENIVYRIARAFASLRQQELGRTHITCVVGHDMRLSSPSLVEQVIRGLVDQGVKVINIGLASTPVYYFGVAHGGYDAGMLVTASHNPKEFNGIKLVREGAKPVGNGLGMEELRDLAEKNEFIDVEKGDVQEKKGVIEEYIKENLKFADVTHIKPFKVVIDTANSMGITYLQPLFEILPHIQFVTMNSKLDGTFPAHPPDPFVEENIKDLKQLVLDEHADLGIATDGDGDRIFFVDNAGGLVEPAIIRGVMARSFLRKNLGANICYDIRPGKITEDMIREAGGNPILTRVGHSLIKQKMLETGAVFGGESSGHFFVKFPYGVFEAPVIVALIVMQEISNSQLDFVSFIKPLRRYFHSGEINFKVSNKEEKLSLLKEKFFDAQINDLDGLTFTYPDVWFNVRTSNTESLLRLNVEARKKELMQTKVKEISALIQN